MDDPTFTEVGDPALEAVIANAVDHIASKAAELPAVEAVLLGGSLGRGEGTVRQTEGGLILASDIEAYIVGPGSHLRSAAAEIGREVAKLSGLDVSVAWLGTHRLRHGRAKNLSWRQSRTIQSYELYAGTRLLAGRRPDIAEIDPMRLPIAEGIRLILNRCAEAAPKLRPSTRETGRWLDKLLIAAGDTLLLANSSYTASYRDRAQRLMVLHTDWRLPPAWRSTIGEAYERKLRGTPGAPSESQVTTVVTSVLASAVDTAVGLVVSNWSRFPDRFVRLAARDAAFLRYLPPFGPAAVYEGFVLVVRARTSNRRLAPRVAWEAIMGRPLSLWLQSAAVPLFLAVSQDRADLADGAASAMKAAGVPRDLIQAAGSPIELARLLRAYWVVST